MVIPQLSAQLVVRGRMPRLARVWPDKDLALVGPVVKRAQPGISTMTPRWPLAKVVARPRLVTCVLLVSSWVALARRIVISVLLASTKMALQQQPARTALLGLTKVAQVPRQLPTASTAPRADTQHQQVMRMCPTVLRA
jgi:hypothetical protein